MEHYSHIRQKAKGAAIAGLETPDGTVDIPAGRAQNWAQSKRDGGGEAEKVLDFVGATRRIRTDDLLITNLLVGPTFAFSSSATCYHQAA